MDGVVKKVRVVGIDLFLARCLVIGMKIACKLHARLQDCAMTTACAWPVLLCVHC